MRIFILTAIIISLILIPFTSAEETNFTDNVRMNNGYAVIFHDWENNEAGFLGTFGNTNMVLAATTKNLVLRAAGFGIRHMYINTFWNSSTFIGWANGERSIVVDGNNGKVGFNTDKPRYEVDVNGTASARVFNIPKSKERLPECTSTGPKSEDGNFRRNSTDVYFCNGTIWSGWRVG